MPYLTVNQRRRALSLYMANHNYRETARRLNLEFPGNRFTHGTIRYQVTKFNNRGCLQNSHKPTHVGQSHSGRHKSVRVENNIVNVLNSVTIPGSSIRSTARQLNISKSSVYNIVRKDLRLKPYVLQVIPKLSAADKECRKKCCVIMQALFASPEINSDFVFFSDEANFYIDGHVCVKNAVIWSIQTPENHFVERTLNAHHVTIWAAISSHYLIGPYILPHRQTVNQVSYRNFVTMFLHDLQLHNVDLNNVWFQQDGATPHTAIATRNFLHEHFHERTIGKFLAVEWPPRSPDLSPTDFFLWGYIKEKIYCHAPFINTNRLCAEIETAFANFRQDQNFLEILGAVHRCFLQRLVQCDNQNGAIVELRLPK